MGKERVIFRREKNKYRPKSCECFLAVFPDDPANPGCVCATPFFVWPDGKAVFEPFTEISLKYCYAQKIVHKNDKKSEKLCEIISRYYKSEFRVAEKITKQK